MTEPARLREERRRAQTPKPPSGTKKHALGTGNLRLVWIATGVLALVVAIVIAVLLSTRSSPKPAPPAAASASDRNAPASLVAAADSVGFHPTTEPGVGEMEGQPASAAAPPREPDLLAVGAVAPAFTLKTPQGQKVSLASLPRQSGAARVLRDLVPALQRRGAPPARALRLAAAQQDRVHRGQRRRRDRTERLRVPPLLRAAVPRPRRPELTARQLRQPGRRRQGLDRLPRPVLPDLLRDRPGRQGSPSAPTANSPTRSCGRNCSRGRALRRAAPTALRPR